MAEIGAPPERDQQLWERYRLNLFAYLVERFPHSTGLKPFSLDHRRIIGRTQQAIIEGGLELVIVYRGFAKSTITELAATWAAGYGHRFFFVPIGADKEAALAALDSIQSEFETNDLLMEIFPEACFCARALEGVPQRAGKQTVNGELTRIQWTSRHCVLPTLPGFAGSGAIIMPRGITANIRGLRFKRPDGVQARPDFVMVDDPQTDESAASPAQVNKRLSKLNKTILRLGGHDKQMACVLNATIIEPDDMIDQLSNSKLYPAWRTNKVPMLKSLSKAHESFWLGPYAETRTAFDSDDDDDKRRAQNAATSLYAENRALADDGAEPSWEHCFGDGELSAIQHAMNILIDTTEDAFMAECQNTPVRDSGGFEMLTPEQICRKMSGYRRGVVPPECTVITAKIDVHPSILYWEEWAWEADGYTGYLIDHGTLPDQRRRYFSHTALARTLSAMFPGRDVDATVTAGLKYLIEGGEGFSGLMRRERLRSDEVPMRINRCSIDANGEASDAVTKFCRQSDFAASLSPSYGRGVTAKQKPISQWQQSRANRAMGPEWVITKSNPGSPAGVVFDTNYWKTRFHRALALPEGSRGALYVFKVDNLQDHRRLGDQWCSEKPTLVIAGTREVHEWTQKPGTDNHDLDCAVGAMVEASRCGVSNLPKQKRKARSNLAYKQ